VNTEQQGGHVHFGYVLKTLRIEADIGLRELARTIDISPSYLSMIEHGQQPPPTAERIAQIEQVLDVPRGYLLSVTHGLDPDLTAYIQEIPETADFLRMAKERGLESEDFMELTGLLNAYGLKGFRLAMSRSSSRVHKSAIDSHARGKTGPYLWPFLQKKLIFDVSGIRGKSSFLKDAVGHIADRVKGLDPDVFLKDLLDREESASTGVGHGVAVPHAYTAVLDETIVGFFRIPEGLDFDAIDGEPVYLVFILAGPRSSEHMHLKLLARIARLFSHNSFYEKILGASGQKEIISTFRAAEMRIP
jgi:mannitol/fructose-specific phosphotransferase system IIA component (Ntr-type)/transcriptional regulator with XRE-family HTH domain